jgi:hypothetical protein
VEEGGDGVGVGRWASLQDGVERCFEMVWGNESTRERRGALPPLQGSRFGAGERGAGAECTRNVQTHTWSWGVIGSTNPASRGVGVGRWNRGAGVSS